jgi:outer membrane immunogenic protein
MSLFCNALEIFSNLIAGIIASPHGHGQYARQYAKFNVGVAMRRSTFALAAAAVLGLGLSQAAIAADMPVREPVYTKAPPAVVVYNWSGIYIGGQAGAGWSDTTVTNVQGFHFFNFIGDSRSISDSAFLGGAFIGAQWQFSSIVVGIEGGAVWGKLSNTIQAPGPFALDNYKAEVKDLYSITGKLGFAADRFLIYAKGGWATAKVSTQSDEFPAFQHFATSSERQNGFVVGAGIDYAFWNHLIAGVEYNYYDLGTKSQTGVDSINFSPYVVDVHPKVQTIMGRLSYKFSVGAP